MNADRLRAAADALDRAWEGWADDADGRGMDRVTAALLRAVADLDPDTPLDISLRFLADKAFRAEAAERDTDG